MPGSFTLGEIERFLVDEAALLDEWRLEEWPTLFAEDGHYLVPPLDAPQADHRTTLFLIADDPAQSRVAHSPVARRHDLGRKSALAHAPAGDQLPHPRGRESHAIVTANFAVWRFQHDATDVYVGRYRHVLVRAGGQLKCKERRVILDLESSGRTASSVSSSEPRYQEK